MPAKLVIGVDGSDAGNRALAYAKKLAKLIDACELIVVYVIEWSPYTFQTPEENAERHKRREAEIDAAKTRIIDPALRSLKQDGFSARGIVRHGDVAEMIDLAAVDENADQIIVARSADGKFAQRLFGSATVKLVMNSSVPVTVVQ
jgi:nucleotide-binding universal stress UspA family protein